MSRGRKPKPTAVKTLQGETRKERLNAREPRPKSAVKKPRGMSRGGRRFWDDHAPELERLSILTGVDTPALRLAAEHYALAVQAAKELHETGLTVDGADGTPKKNPVAQVFKDNALAFKSFAVEFGMTPSSRTRLKMPEDAEQLTLADELFALVGDVVVSDQE